MADFTPALPVPGKWSIYENGPDDRYNPGGKKLQLKIPVESIPAFCQHLMNLADDPAKQVKVGDAPYAGNYFMNLSTYDQPKVVDTQLNDILDKNQFVSGDYCRVSMNIAPLGAKAKKRGIGAYLNQVQFVRKGEPLGKPATRPEDDFAVIESASGSDEASIEDMLA